MTYRKYLCALMGSALLFLTACSSVSSVFSKAEKTEQELSSKEMVHEPSSTQASNNRYECETPNANTTDLQVNKLGPDKLALAIDNSHHIVQLSRSASGAKYTNNRGVVFWNKGNVATLSIKSAYYLCSET